MNVVALTPPTESLVPGLVPTNMGEAIKLAELMASAKLVPQGLQKSPADCLMVIQQAIRWQMDPFAVAQECSVIQGKLMHSGKLVAAVINARGNLTQRLSFEYRGAGPERTITISGQLQGEPSPRIVEVILKNAKTNNRVWETQPDQQLMYHGARVWARRHTPELMLGVYSPEEFDEKPVERRSPVAAANVMLPAHDQETGEIIDSPQSSSPMAADKGASSDPASRLGGDAPEGSKIEKQLAEAAEHGTEMLKTAFNALPPEEQKAWTRAVNRRFKPRALEVDVAALHGVDRDD